MMPKDILNALNDIDDAMLQDAAPRRPKRRWLRYAAAAACAALLLSGSLLLRHRNGIPVDLGGTTRIYQNTVLAQETSLIFPWEYQPIYEQYTSMRFGEATYRGRCRPVDMSLLGDFLGDCSATGYDIYTDRQYSRSFEVFSIKHVDPALLVAVKLDNACYVFMADAYTPPATLGAFLDGYSLPQTLELERFTVYKDDSASEHRRLSDLPADNASIWALLTDCRDAAFLEEDPWCCPDDYISFTVSSEVLGVYKHVLYITADGLLRTNLMEWGYTYQIGEDAANKLISYVTEHSTVANAEPYDYKVYGTVTEIHDGYFLLDDSALVKGKGAVFKVPTTDLEVSRWLDFGGIGVGDLIAVSYTGGIANDEDLTVLDPYALSAAVLNGDEVGVPE